MVKSSWSSWKQTFCLIPSSKNVVGSRNKQMNLTPAAFPTLALHNTYRKQFEKLCSKHTWSSSMLSGLEWRRSLWGTEMPGRTPNPAVALVSWSPAWRKHLLYQASNSVNGHRWKEKIKISFWLKITKQLILKLQKITKILNSGRKSNHQVDL